MEKSLNYTEETLQSYAQPLSTTENDRCKHAIEMVRDALKDVGYDAGSMYHIDDNTPSYAMSLTGSRGVKITIFVQGSYANNTNVKRHSDVDVAVVCDSAFLPKYRFGITGDKYGHTSSDITARGFKDEIEEALRAKFGSDVVRGNKSIKIKGNTYRVDADTVPAMRYRDYSGDYVFDDSNYVEGIVITPDDGSACIVNYPKQHIQLGRQKNAETNHQYKKLVRIAKRVKMDMERDGCASAGRVSSFLVESLVWNVPNEVLTEFSILRFSFNRMVKYLYDYRDRIASFKEANGIKPLCSDGVDEQSVIVFIEDLFEYYNYVI